jgi:tetratricopeptide (TPR) repeat protein
MMTDDRRRLPRRELLVGLLLALITFGVYWPVRNYEFVNYDDPDYVYENPFVLRGFSRAGIVWAFGRVAGEHTYWHPVTWLSHMLDCQLFGSNAGGHHLVNALLHAANALLLFLALSKMTGAVWRSAMVAALFAWHPLQVDTVAWVTERKNVLSTCLWFLTILAYLRYTRRPGAGRYALVMACFALGLMAKPMLVTVPLILLLLDFWPLGRVGLDSETGKLKTLWPMVREKIPLLALSAASAVITIVAHQQLKSLAATDELPVAARLANGLVSYARYLKKTVWPVDLSVLYPHPGKWPDWEVAGAGALVAILTGWTVWAARSRPYLLAGWGWFLVTLLPVIGIIQASSQSMADRFAYVPSVGLFVMVVWLAGGLAPAWPYRRIALGLAAVAVLATCLATTRLQLRHWQNSEALFRHALRVTGGNDTMHYNLACALAREHKLDEAAAEFATTLKLNPGRVDAHANLGVVFQMQGKTAPALAEFEEVLRRDPGKASAHNNLGMALQEQGKVTEAVAQFEEALRLKPDHPEAHNNLGRALTAQGRTNEALAQFTEALRLKPEYDDAHYNLGQFLLSQGKTEEAARHYAAALQSRPDYAEADYELGVILAGRGQSREATGHFEAALIHRPDYAEAHYQMGVLLAAQKQTREAITHYRAAARLKPGWLEALNNLAWILATQPNEKLRNGPEAVTLAAEAVALTKSNNAGVLDTLAAAYAEAGRFPEAIKTAQRAVAAAGAADQKELAAQLQARLALYQSSRAFRE